MEKTSLEKSHSKWSNFKLTLLCLLATISISVFWGVLALGNLLQTWLLVTIAAVSGLISFLCIVLFNKFTR